MLSISLGVLSVGFSSIQMLLASGSQATVTPEQHTEKGAALAERGDLKNAELELRRALELAPHDPVALSTLGAILGMQHKLEESNVYLDQALKINPKDLGTRRNLASNQFQLGQLSAAKENLELVLKVAPGQPTALLLLGMVAEEMKDYSKAIELLSSVPDQVRQQPKAIVALARSYYRIDERQKARQTLDRLASQASAPEIFLGGQVAAQFKDFEMAESLFGLIRSTYSDLTTLGYELAWVQYQQDHIRESQETLEDLIQTGHRSSDIYNLLSWCLHKQQKFKESVAAMDLAIEIDPAKETNYIDLGLILIANHQLPVALEAAKRAVGVAPGSYQATMLKGLVETKMNRLIEAAATYRRALELDPDRPEAVLALALVFSADGKSQEAEAAFQSGMARFPRNPVLLQEYGKTLLKFGEGGDVVAQARATSLFRAALEIDNSLAESHYQLGNLALANDKAEEAVPHLETAAKLNPQSSKTHFALARAYRRLGRAGVASKELGIYESLKGMESENPLAEPGLPAGPSLPSNPPK
jgi:tetratricopeptide (TPR) repeat protein